MGRMETWAAGRVGARRRGLVWRLVPSGPPLPHPVFLFDMRLTSFYIQLICRLMDME